MKKNIFLIPVITIVALSCKKSSQLVITPSTAVKIDTSIAISQTHAKTTLSPTDGTTGYSLLGFGYDVNGAFADSSSVRAKVFDVDAFVHDNPDRFDLSRATMFSTPVTYADNAAAYSYDLSSALTLTEGLNAFKGSITNYFTSTDALSAKYFYCSFAITAQIQRLSLNAYPSLLAPYLTTTFKQDVAALSAEALVNKYGTHVLVQLMLGANLNVLYRAETSLTNRNKVAQEGLRFAVKRIFGMQTGYLDAVDSTTLAAVQSPQIAYHVVGGDLSKLKVSKYSKLTTISTSDWANTITAGNAAFVNIGQNGLISLDELISDPVKQAAVKAYITTFINNNSVTLIN
jgi:hypothetical protein